MDPVIPSPAESPIEFPCDYPVKVMGRTTPEFLDTMRSVLTECTGAGPMPVTERLSKDGTYLSLTFTVPVTSRAQLDDIYRRLHATGLVLFAL